MTNGIVKGGMQVNIREASINDAANIARVYVDTWRTAFRGILSETYLNSLTYLQFSTHIVSMLRGDANFFCFVADDEDQGIVGFAAAGINIIEDEQHQPELYGIFVKDDYQQKGIGSRLVNAVVQKLISKQAMTMEVWVLQQNPCKSFYEGLGGRQMGERATNIGGDNYLEVGYCWDDIKKIPLTH